MPQEAIKETLTFKSEKEKLQALSQLEDSPPANMASEQQINDWIKEQEEKQNSIMEAEIVAEEAEPLPEPTPEETPQEPQVPEVVQEEPQVPPEPAPEESQIQPVSSEEKTPTQEEDLFQFSVKRDELPDVLKGYKSPDEIIRQAAHARKYANEAEIKMKEMAEERETMRLELEGYKKQKEAYVSMAPEASQIPKVPEKKDLAAQLQQIDALEDEEYMPAGSVKSVLSLAVDEISNTKKELRNLKSELGGKLSSIEETNKKKIQKDQEEMQMQAVVRGINELQDKYPELKTSKPVSSIMGTTNCVERDVAQWADRLLFSKYANDKPKWSERNAVINAYLEGNSEIIGYCQQNAITPESVGTTGEDMKKYAIIMNVDANMRGSEIDKTTGELKQKISPFNGKPVNFGSYVASYKNLKDETGITIQEQREAIANAEIRGQQSLNEALEKRAETPKTLSDKGTTPPETVKEMDEQSAWKYINSGNEFEMEQAALGGDRSLFNKYNKALEVVGFPVEKPSPHWPPEKK